MFLFDEVAAGDLVYVLLTCLAMNVERHERWVMKLMQQMGLLLVDYNCEIVTLVSMHLAVPCAEGPDHRPHECGCSSNSVGDVFRVGNASSENRRAQKAVLEKVMDIAKSKKAERRFGECLQGTNAKRLGAQDMTCLAILLTDGVEGVGADAQRAVALYERAIEEGNHVVAMSNLAVMLQTGAEGVDADGARAVALYERAIEEGNHVGAMYNLANVLRTGAEGVDADGARAVALYERAIEEGNDVNARNNLALFLEIGAEGVPVDACRAMQLCERACEIESDCTVMLNLGRLLTSGARGVPVDAMRGVELLHGALNVGSDAEGLDAMLFLSAIYAKGLNEVDKDVPKSKSLLRRALGCDGALGFGADVAVSELWEGFSEGCDEFEDVELAAQLEELR